MQSLETTVRFYGLVGMGKPFHDETCRCEECIAWAERELDKCYEQDTKAVLREYIRQAKEIP